MGTYEAGSSIPEVRVTPDKYLPHRYAGASGDFNPIHIDKELAAQAGMESNILHGLWSMSQVSRAAVEAAGNDPRNLKSISVQFRGMGLPEQEVVVTGEVAEANDTATVNMEAAQGDNRIIRNAVAVIAN